MARNVTLHLDEFGQRSLDRIVQEGKGSPSAALRAAAVYYLSDRDADRPASRAPRFRQAHASSPGLRIAFDDSTWAALEEEAGRQGVNAEALAVHALLYFLADFDSGRLAELLDDVLDDG
jgi:hypothetical protein